MSVGIPTTDEIQTVLAGELGTVGALEGVKELLHLRDLWACCADRYLGDWIRVASGEETGETSSNHDESPAPDWMLVRNTHFGEHVHLRGRFAVDSDMVSAHQQDRIQRAARQLAQQMRAAGMVQQILMFKDTDVAVPFGRRASFMFFAVVSCPYQSHVRIDDRGVAWLTESQIKVREIILDNLCQRYSVVRIYHEHAGGVALEKIHAAFTYFDNHRDEVIREIESAEQYAAQLRETLGQPRSVQRLLARRV